MKISFDIDCTPEEARTFFGLPDLQPLHDVYLDRMKTAMTEGITAADWQRMMQNWVPGIAGGFEQWQKLMMAGLGAAAPPPLISSSVSPAPTPHIGPRRPPTPRPTSCSSTSATSRTLIFHPAPWPSLPPPAPA